MFKKGDIVIYASAPSKYGEGIVLRDQQSDIVEVNFYKLKGNKFRAFAYNLKLADKRLQIKLEDSLFEI